MDDGKLKNEVSTVKKGNISFIINENGNLKRYKPWIGDIFSFLYDKIMEKSIFPKKFNGDIHKHFEILKKELGNIQHSNVLEIACGSGTIVYALNNNNNYTGIDISPGLLRRAYSRFKENGFKNIELLNTCAEKLPFRNDIFDFAICNLSLNFFDNAELFIDELRRVLKPNSTFFCSVPLPERKPQKSIIRGTLYSEKELKAIFEKRSFHFESKPDRNGALLYFITKLNDK